MDGPPCHFVRSSSLEIHPPEPPLAQPVEIAARAASSPETSSEAREALATPEEPAAEPLPQREPHPMPPKIPRAPRTGVTFEVSQ